MRLVAVGVEPVGVVAIGANARGVIAVGQLATGVVAVGQLARGIVVLGQLAVGIVAFGQLAVGVGWVGGMLAIGAGRAGPGMVVLHPRRALSRVVVTFVLLVLWWAVAGTALVHADAPANPDRPPSCADDPDRAC
jgi:hypothetical protein